MVACSIQEFISFSLEGQGSRSMELWPKRLSRDPGSSPLIPQSPTEGAFNWGPTDPRRIRERLEGVYCVNFGGKNMPLYFY